MMSRMFSLAKAPKEGVWIACTVRGESVAFLDRDTKQLMTSRKL